MLICIKCTVCLKTVFDFQIKLRLSHLSQQKKKKKETEGIRSHRVDMMEEKDVKSLIIK